MINHPRCGAVLIIAGGLLALLAALTFSFMLYMRSDAQEAQIVVRHAQAKAMLMAACNYVLETGRVGWGQECFGWVDVRDGSIGPKPSLAAPANFPIGTVGRFPMHTWRRPPWAVSVADPNPINTDAIASDYGMPYLRNMDPMVPGTAPGAASTMSTLVPSYNDWRSGDDTPLPDSVGLGWFRLYRDGPATFVVTCGGGATYGYKDWNDVDATSRVRFFGDSKAIFDAEYANEVRLWYRIEWSPAINLGLTVGGGAEGNTYSDFGGASSGSILPGMENACGTIQWVQRLRTPPDTW